MIAKPYHHLKDELRFSYLHPTVPLRRSKAHTFAHCDQLGSRLPGSKKVFGMSKAFVPQSNPQNQSQLQNQLHDLPPAET